MSNPNSGGHQRPPPAGTTKFVNIAAATQRPQRAIRPIGTRMRLTAHDARLPSRQGQTTVQAMANAPYAHHGAINLTITNGSVNLRPSGPGLSIRPEGVQPGQALMKANISTPGSLQRIPFLPQNATQPQAINLKIQNPMMNLRFTGPQANLLQGSKPGTTLLGPRPLVINAAQLRSLPGQTVMQVPQSVSGQLIPQGSLTVLPQGTKFTGNIPIAQLGHNIQVGGKIPLRAVAGKPGNAAAGSHRNLPAIIQKASSGATGKTTVTVTAIQHGQAIPIQMRPLTSHSAHSTPIFLTATPAKSLITSTPSVLKRLIATSQNEQLVATDLSKKPTSNCEAKPETNNKDQHKQTKGEKDASRKSKDTIKEEITEEKIRVHKMERKDAEKDLPVHFDVESSLEWQDGVGVLSGSDIKFRKNEFGVLEMIDIDLECGESMELDGAFTAIEPKPEQRSPIKPDSTSVKFAEEQDTIICCKQCGIYAPFSEFLPGAKFCSRKCLCAYNTKGGRRRSESSVLAPGSGKKKRRKISEYDVEESAPKVAKTRHDDDAMSTASVESATTPQKKDSDVAVNMKSKTTLSIGGKRARGFSWSAYLVKEGATPAPSSCFKGFQDIPETKNGFRVGMRLEAIDDRHPSHYCVASVAEVRGYRIRLRFDGYSETYDFWTNADSPFIFYIGWSDRNGKYLDPPKDCIGKQAQFDWADYLQRERATPAPKGFFQTTSCASVTPHGFRIGMKLEAVDKKNSNHLICVATIADVLGDNVLIHFDGWEDIYDYWCDPSSDYIHPVGWCQKNGVPLSPPKDTKDVQNFTWEEYLRKVKASVVPPRAFKPRQPNNFEVGQHLEVVDKRNPLLVRAASVVEVESYSIKIHFCGWSDAYDYWLDDDRPDIHPCGWCAKTGHPLTPPLTMRDLSEKSEGCPTPGCTGVGHVKGAKYTGHHSAFGCPYSTFNMNKDSCLLDRLSPGRPEFDSGYRKPKEEPLENGRKAKSPEDKKELAQKRASPVTCDIISTATASQMEEARELLHSQQGRPLYGKGSGRGRKNNVVRLVRKLQELDSQGSWDASKPPLSAQALYETKARLQSGVHMSVFSPPPSLHPYHDLPLGWEQSSKLLNGTSELSADDACRWSASRVAEFVTSLPGCAHVGTVFEQQQIDGEALLLLNQADMVRSLNLKLGPALKIHNSIIILRNNVKV